MPQDLRSVGCHADHVVRSDIAGRQARDVNAVSMIRSNRVTKCCAAADLVLRAILDQDAVAAVTGVSGSELVSSPGRDTDVIALDQITVRPDAHKVHACAGVARDHVATRGRSDVIARRIDDSLRIRQAARGLDQNSVCAIAGLRVQAVDGRPGHADLVAQNLESGCPMHPAGP